MSGQRWPRYPEYRESGVEWLGEVPRHWEIHRIKNVADLRFSNVDKHTLEDERPVRLCNYTDVYYNEYIDGSIDFMKATASAVEIERFELRAGDVLLTKDSESPGDIAVPALIIESMEEVLCGYHLALLRSHQPRLWPRFLLRALQVGGVNDQFAIAANGITRFGLSQSAIADAIVPAPPLTEQRAIATFLDHQTARIDTLIAKNERLLELLDEKRTALITRAVTKGLDPDVPMKDSGVEWLGEVPGHWRTVRLQAFTQSLVNGVWGEDPTGDNDIICVRVADFDRHRFLVDLSNPTYRNVDARARASRILTYGDLLIEKSGGGEQQLVGAVVQYNADVAAVCSNFVARIRLRTDCDSRFVTYIHAAAYSIRVNFRSIKQNTGIQNLDSESYLSEYAPAPPLLEQRAIATFLDHQTAHLDTLRDKITTAIAHLREYRTGLISAAVTGKIDVRGFTPSASAAVSSIID